MNNNFFTTSSNSSFHEDSNRSSSVLNTNSQFRFPTDKKILIDKKIVNKLISFLKCVIKDMNFGGNELNQIEQMIQTEEFYDSRNNVDIENKCYSCNSICETKEIIKIENDENKKVIKELQIENTNLNDRVSKLNSLLTDANLEKNKLIEEFEKLKNQKQNLCNCNCKEELKQEEIENEMDEESNYNKEIKTNQNILVNHIVSTDRKIQIANHKFIFDDEKFLLKICEFLNPIDFFNFFNSNNHIHKILSNKNINFQKLKIALENKNSIINKLKFYDWNKHYDINEPEMERLIREYVQQNKLAGLDLKQLLVKSLSYVDKEIKKPLGLYEEEITRKKSLFGSLNNVFNKLIKKKDEDNPKRKSMITSFEDTNEYDKYLVKENLIFNELNVEFDYNNPEEIKKLFVEYFTSLRASPQMISNFISELITAYSDFLFYAQSTLIEIKELDIVKNAMHERFKKYHKICMELEIELEDLKKFAKTNKEIKDILLKQKHEIEVKYTDSITQITLLKDEINKTTNKLMIITEKYNRVENEYEMFKSKLVKEYKILKNEYENTNKERGILLDAIMEFKKYFLRFHITDDGEIAFIEDN